MTLLEFAETTSYMARDSIPIIGFASPDPITIRGNRAQTPAHSLVPFSTWCPGWGESEWEVV
jgi:hypothetical protein